MTTLAMAAVLTFGNPHVYLDTMVLIGTVSLQFVDTAKIAFAVGAATASFVFFAGLGYGAAALSGIMQRRKFLAHTGCVCGGGDVGAWVWHSRWLAIKGHQ